MEFSKTGISIQLYEAGYDTLSATEIANFCSFYDLYFDGIDDNGDLVFKLISGLKPWSPVSTLKLHYIRFVSVQSDQNGNITGVILPTITKKKTPTGFAVKCSLGEVAANTVLAVTGTLAIGACAFALWKKYG